MNTYTVIKAFNNYVIGDTITATADRGAKLIRQGLVSLTDNYDNEQIQLRWVNENLEIFNRLTGAVLLRITPTGVQGPLTIDIVGDVDGEVTGNLYGNVTTYMSNGEIGLNLLMAVLNGSAATCNMTLADGAEGQTITIKTVDATEVCTVTPDKFVNGTSISLAAAGDAATLMFDGSTGWHVLNLYGTAAVVV
ncbi:MAG: hypothetical protein WCX48_11075 [Bacteroidales bacterium]